ncbi:MAG TPA: hypothetical protein VHO93_13195 [Actinomycetota bacterium]|nr:hypothetical protein [Actinomycetota bacterium]
MYIWILRGQAFDGPATLAEVGRWRQELGAGVPGWRRLTAGIGDGGELVLALRYDTEAAARRDRDRPELAAWQASLERHLTGPGQWYDCPVVHTMKAGDAGDAGFVRVVQGRLADPVRLATMRAEVERTLRDRAPHVLGVTVAEHADGTGFTELTYLTSERESRAADRQMPVEMAVQLGTVRSYVEGLEEVELRRPLLWSAAVTVS